MMSKWPVPAGQGYLPAALTLRPQQICLRKNEPRHHLTGAQQEEELGILFSSARMSSSNLSMCLSLECSRLSRQMKHAEITVVCCTIIQTNQVLGLITLKN